MSDQHTMSSDQIRQLVSEGVEEAFLRLGIQADDPIEMQRDFQHLRDWRRSFDQMRSKGMLAALGVFVTGVATAAWVGFKLALGNP